MSKKAKDSTAEDKSILSQANIYMDGNPNVGILGNKEYWNGAP